MISSVRLVMLLLTFALIFESSSASRNMTDSEVLEKMKSLKKKATDAVESIVKMILPRVLASGYDADISPECLSSLLKVMNGVRGLKLWALALLDASGKISPGLTAGTMTDLGDYDLCLNVKDRDPYSDRTTFTGQYCTVLVRPPIPPAPKHLSINTQLIQVEGLTKEDEVFYLLTQRTAMFYRVPLRAGICVPSTCSRNDLNEIAKSALSSLPEIEVEIPSCEVKSENEISLGQTVVLSVFGALFTLTFLSTFVEGTLRRRKFCPQSVRFFEHFSLRSNASKFFNPKPEEPPAGGIGRLTVLDGLRCWSMAWIVLSHTYYLFTLAALGRFVNVLDMIKTYSFNLILNAWVSVDVFFLLGGILVAQSMLGELIRNKGQLNFAKHIFRRLLRLTPALLACVALMFLLPWMGSGPLWNEVVTKQVNLCQRHWWLAALYANAWLGHAEACLVSTWYVSADMHLYIISPIFIYIYYKNKKLGVLSCLLAISASVVAVFVLAYLHDLYPLPMALTFNEESIEAVYTTVYFRPYAHVGPYFIGVLLGFFIKSNPEFTMKWWMALPGWCFSVCLALCVLLGPQPWHEGRFPSTMVAALFQSLHRPAFALAVAWVVAACRYGYGGVVTGVLGWSGYKRWSQLVYLTYLVQLPVLWVRVGSLRRTMGFDHYNFAIEAMGIFVISLILALVLFLSVEAPFISLDAAWFPRSSKKVKGHEKPTQNGNSHPQEPMKKSEVQLCGLRNSVDAVERL